MMPSLDFTAGWLSPDMIQALGWTLIHFLWQGLALALLFQAAVPFCRTANARYNLAFATLAAMAAAPVATFFSLGAVAIDPVQISADIADDVIDAVGVGDAAGTSPWLHWLVVAWFAGVAALSLRVAGGWYLAQSLRRRAVTPLPPRLRARFETLRVQLGISRPVQFLQSALVAAPAVVGWLRPVVLIPASAVIGLTPAQLEAVIVHELAHIRRFDALANLLQMAVETALFYHPAVWWISRRIRVEREHCCDDVAVTTSGDALGYAKALASLEEWRGLPALLPAAAMAASGGVLKHRISRLLGLNIRGGNVSVMGVAGVGIICLVGCVIAQGADADANAATTRPFPGAFPGAFPGLAAIAAADAPAVPPSPAAPAAAATPAAIPQPALLVPPAAPVAPAAPMPPAFDNDDLAERLRDMQRDLARETAESASDVAREIAEEAREQAREARNRIRDREEHDRMERDRGRASTPPRPEDAAYVTALQAAGLKDLDADDVLALKNQGVTADYARDLNANGIAPRVRTLIAFKAQGIDSAYVKEIRAAGLEPSANQILAFKAQGIDTAFIKDLRASGLDLSGNQIIAFKNQGIKPAFVRDIHAVWPDAGPNQIIALSVQGVTPDYVKGVRAHWPEISVNDMVAMKTLGLSASDAAEYRKSGAPDLSVRQLFSYKTTGVTPEFVKALQAAGIKDLSARDYTAAKVRGITPEFLDAVKKHGFTNLTLRQLIALKDADVL